MRVLYVFGEPFSSGGQEAFTINVLQALDKTDLKIDFYTPYYCDNNYYKSIIEEKGGNIYAGGLNYVVGNSRINIIRPLVKFLKTNHYDILHIHSGGVLCLAFASLAASICHVHKIIVHSHTSNSMHKWFHMLAKFFSTPLLFLFPHEYLACSEDAGKWMFPSWICKKKLQIIKNGIEIEKFKFNPQIRENIRRKLNIKNDVFLLGHVGRFSQEKNHSFLIDVFFEIYKKNSDTILLLVGVGDLEKEIKEKVENYGLTNNVIFYGTTCNVSEIYQAIDYFVFPSYFEGLGIVVIEAQAAGLKTICSNCIPKETQITSLLKYMSLSDSPKKWAEEILLTKNYIRIDTSEEIKRHGYGMNSEIDNIKELYMG